MTMTMLTTLAIAVACYCVPGYIHATEHHINTLKHHLHRRDVLDNELHEAVLPPVIYNQTLGPVYIKDSNQYTILYCQATEGALISWKYEGVNISDAEAYNDLKQQGIQFRLEDGGATLLIYDREHKAINGYLQCFVANEKGATFGDKIFVTHTVLGYTETGKRKTDIVAMEGDHVTLSCDQHIKNNPAAHILWKFNYGIIETSSKFFCNSLKTMCVLSNVSKEDSGIYKCSYNILGTPKEIYKSFRLDVVESDLNPNAVHPLNLMDHVSTPSLVESREGENVTLQCVFRGDKGDRIVWNYAKADISICDSRDSSMVESSEDLTFEQNGTILHITALTADREGYYLCAADNGYDRYTHRIHVKLIAPPILVDKIHTEEAYLGSSVRFNCSTLQATPPATAVWWVNMELVPEVGLGRFRLEDGGNILVLDDATLEDTGSITCNVSNKVGSVVGHRTVSVRNITMSTVAPPTTEPLAVNTADGITPNVSLTTIYTPPHSTEQGNMTGNMTGNYSTVNTTNDNIYNVTAPPNATFSADTNTTLVRQMTPTPDTIYDVDARHSSGAPEVEVTSHHEEYTKPGYKVETPYDAQEGSKSEQKDSGIATVMKGESLHAVIIIALIGLAIGLVLGILITWFVMRRRTKKHDPPPDVIENQALSPVRRSPTHKLHLDRDTAHSETQSMIHEGSVIQETIT